MYYYKLFLLYKKSYFSLHAVFSSLDNQAGFTYVYCVVSCYCMLALLGSCISTLDAFHVLINFVTQFFPCFPKASRI